MEKKRLKWLLDMIYRTEVDKVISELFIWKDWRNKRALSMGSSIFETYRDCVFTRLCQWLFIIEWSRSEITEREQEEFAEEQEKEKTNQIKSEPENKKFLESWK